MYYMCMSMALPLSPDNTCHENARSFASRATERHTEGARSVPPMRWGRSSRSRVAAESGELAAREGGSEEEEEGAGREVQSGSGGGRGGDR
jgi:hypothetical protein